MRTRVLFIVCMVLSAVLAGCSPARFQRAEATVARADSLRAAGQVLSDSAALADAVSALHPWRLWRGNNYARACYHYGRLLLKLNHPMPAMRHLVKAEKNAGKDNILRAQTLTDIAYICQLEKRWPLAYDTYKQVGEYYLQGEDSIGYFHALLWMSEMAMNIERIDSAYDLIDDVFHRCTDSATLMSANLHLMRLYNQTQDYHRVLHYANIVQQSNSYKKYGESYKAIAFHYLGQYDSACYYAEKSLSHNIDLEFYKSAYYILTNDDDHADMDLVKQRAATRADIQRDMQRRQAELTQAVEWLLQQQDMQKRRTIAGIIIGIIVLLTAVTVWWLHRKRRQHKNDIRTLRKTHIALQQTTQDLQQQQTQQSLMIMQDVEQTCRTLLATPDWQEVLQWNDYKCLCRNIDVRFYCLAERLQAVEGMKEQDIRLCVPVLLGLSHKEIARVLNCSHLSIGRYKENTAAKLGVHGGALRQRLLEIIGAKPSC